jgi:hypothetical protein
MAENPFADLIPGATPSRAAPAAPTRQRERALQVQQTQEAIRSSRLGQAATAADLAKAPVDKARAETALTVDQATADANIRKAVAQAEIAEFDALKARFQAQYPQLTEAQATAAARVVLMEEGNRIYNEARRKGYEPTATTNRLASMAAAIPVAGPGLSDVVRSPLEERAALGERLFTEGALRTVTGAAGPKDERPEVKGQYFPTPWQSPDRKTREELDRVRARQIQTIRGVAGPAAEGGKLALPGGAPRTVTTLRKPTASMLQQYKLVPPDKRREARQRFEAAGYDISGLN